MSLIAFNRSSPSQKYGAPSARDAPSDQYGAPESYNALSGQGQGYNYGRADLDEQNSVFFLFSHIKYPKKLLESKLSNSILLKFYRIVNI